MPVFLSCFPLETCYTESHIEGEHSCFPEESRKLPCQVESCNVEFSACFNRNSDGVRSPKES